QEYWRPRTLFEIAGGVGTPLTLDAATKNRSFGHYARILVDVDLPKLVDRVKMQAQAKPRTKAIYVEKDNTQASNSGAAQEQKAGVDEVVTPVTQENNDSIDDNSVPDPQGIMAKVANSITTIPQGQNVCDDATPLLRANGSLPTQYVPILEQVAAVDTTAR
ncbi:defensin-like protein, partial [Trifolium medium]|nr:defensin-like protein [Trifolium medium]